MADATTEPRVSDEQLRYLKTPSQCSGYAVDLASDLRDARATIASQAEALAAKEAENERLHDKLHEATIDSGPMLGESIGTALGNAIAGYRDRDMKRAASGLVAAVHIVRRLEDDRDKYRWQVRDTCVRAEAAEAALKAAREAFDTVTPIPDEPNCFTSTHALDNLEGAIIDLERQSADAVCIRTLKRIAEQLQQIEAALTKGA